MYVERNIESFYNNFDKITFINVNKVFYPLNHVLQNKDIFYEDAESLSFQILPDDVDYNSPTKLTDAGQIYDLRVKLDIYNQNKEITDALNSYINTKVIIVLHYATGRMIFGSNDHPLKFSFNPTDTTSPSGSNGYSIDCRGNSYFSKVQL